MQIQRGGKIKLSSCHIGTSVFSSSATQQDTRNSPILDSEVFYPSNANKAHGSAAGEPAALPMRLSAPVLTLCFGARASLVGGVLAHITTLVLITTLSRGRLRWKRNGTCEYRVPRTRAVGPSKLISTVGM